MLVLLLGGAPIYACFGHFSKAELSLLAYRIDHCHSRSHMPDLLTVITCELSAHRQETCGFN